MLIMEYWKSICFSTKKIIFFMLFIINQWPYFFCVREIDAMLCVNNICVSWTVLFVVNMHHILYIQSDNQSRYQLFMLYGLSLVVGCAANTVHIMLSVLLHVGWICKSFFSFAGNFEMLKWKAKQTANKIHCWLPMCCWCLSRTRSAKTERE